MIEKNKPIPVLAPKNSAFSLDWINFYLRFFVDLQLKTISKFLREELKSIKGNILDVGCGMSPWLTYIPSKVRYTGLDFENATKFNMKKNPNTVYYNGVSFPFQNNQFNNILCVEVLEHIYDTKKFLREIYRTLDFNGNLFLTVPWSARLHHLPYDFYRFSPYALNLLLKEAGFKNIKIIRRGNESAVITNKLFIFMWSLLKPSKKIYLFLNLPTIFLLTPIFILFLLISHLSLMSTPLPGSYQSTDPLGFSIKARK